MPRSFRLSLCFGLAFGLSTLGVKNSEAEPPPETASSSASLESKASSQLANDSIIIDESVWLKLIGEPGRHMSEGYELFRKGEMEASAEAIDKASSFLYIATHNALEKDHRRTALVAAARSLDKLSEDLASGKVKSATQLKPVFVKAHLAMARHHALKSSNAVGRRQWDTAGNYLISSASHFQRAADWAGRELRDDTLFTIDEARREARRLITENSKSSRDATLEILETLRKRIERFSDDVKKTPNKSDQTPK